jgi:hypothetical protein
MKGKNDLIMLFDSGIHTNHCSQNGKQHDYIQATWQDAISLCNDDAMDMSVDKVQQFKTALEQKYDELTGYEFYHATIVKARQEKKE